MNQSQRQKINDLVNMLVSFWLKRGFLEGDYDGYGPCIYRTIAGLLVLRSFGFHDTLPQAGSSAWPIADDKDHFFWNPKHAWIGLVERREIVDFSTGDLKNQAQKRGLQWRTAEPPPFLWCEAMPPRVRYDADSSATGYIHLILPAVLLTIPPPYWSPDGEFEKCPNPYHALGIENVLHRNP